MISGSNIVQEHSINNDFLFERCVGKSFCVHFFGHQSRICKDWFENCTVADQSDRVILCKEPELQSEMEIYTFFKKNAGIVAEHKFYDNNNLLLSNKTTEIIDFSKILIPKRWVIEHYEGPVLISISKFTISNISLTDKEINKGIDQNLKGVVLKYTELNDGTYAVEKIESTYSDNFNFYYIFSLLCTVFLLFVTFIIVKKRRTRR